MLDPLYKLFGFILSWLYYVIGNYGLVIIFFTLALNSLLIPMRLKSQRNMIKQQFLQPAMNDIRRHYAKDPQKQQQVLSEFMKRNGVSMGSGCISSIIPLIIIWPIWRIIRAPLQYVGRVSVENISKIAELLVSKGLLGEAAIKTVAQNDLPIINILTNNASAMAESVSKGWLRPDQMVNTTFLGMDLGRVPSYNPLNWFGPNWKVELPLIILPLLTILTMILNMRFSRLNILRPSPSKEEIERAKKNPAKAGQTVADPTEKTMKYMQWFMPILMIFTVFTMPSAMGLYWVMSNLIFVLQSWISYTMYVKPARAILSGDVVDTASSTPPTKEREYAGISPEMQKKKKRGKGRK
ncbi:MAG TPA: YidC/Oxa1 family membrane protein insertase [Clostridiaceae bacterium]|nr:YidC/Oxa1 family membrane protein insertase [Clostridiaceae bacterium]